MKDFQFLFTRYPCGTQTLKAVNSLLVCFFDSVDGAAEPMDCCEYRVVTGLADQKQLYRGFAQ